VTLGSCKALFEPSLPAHLARSLRVEGCSSRSWSLRVPGSKSVTNRALVLAGLAGRPIEILSPLLADDTWWGFSALEELGFDLDVSQLLRRVSIGACVLTDKKTATIHLGQAGTLARFLPALLLNWKKVQPHSDIESFILDADPQLKRRPLSPLLVALRALGADIESDFLPLELRPTALKGQVSIDGSQSGQFVSGLLLAAAGARQAIRMTRTQGLVQPDYVRITVAMLREFGVHVEHDTELRNFSVGANEWNPPSVYVVEADASTACYFLALACVLGLELHIENLGSSTLQPDFQFLEVLKKFGFAVHWNNHSCGVAVAAEFSSKTNSSLLHLDMSACSDQAITAGVMALCTGRAVHVSGVAHIRQHESDRIAAFCANTRALGIEVQENLDGFVVPAGTRASELAGDWPTHTDHRFALAGIVLAACAPQLSVLEPECMKKTAPHFIDQLGKLGLRFAQGRL
jgi:3-phosphoshikimate 1-carboxyvinyltransferase